MLILGSKVYILAPQDAPWHRRQGMPVASRILNQAPRTRPCLIARPWPASALENPHEAMRSNVRTAKLPTRNSKRRCRECLERQRKGLHMDRHDEDSNTSLDRRQRSGWAGSGRSRDVVHRARQPRDAVRPVCGTVPMAKSRAINDGR